MVLGFGLFVGLGAVPLRPLVPSQSLGLVLGARYGVGTVVGKLGITSDYCGWAPLPPTACFTPGFGFSYCGRSVGLSFSFGLSARHYAFVPTRNFCDRQPYRHRLSAHHVDQVFHNTVAANRIVQSGRNRIINHGIPVHEVSAATRQEIRPVRIDTTDNPERFRAERGSRESGRTLTAFRPNMPQPERRTALVGEGVQPAPRRFERASEANNNGTPPQPGYFE